MQAIAGGGGMVEGPSGLFVPPGTGGLWTPEYYGLSAWNGDPAQAAQAGGASGTTTCWAFRVFCPKAFLLTKVASILTTVNSVPTAANATTVAAGSNGVDVSTFVGAQTLNVASIGVSPATGSLLVQTSNGFAWITYTSTAVGQYLNCTVRGGTGTLATGGTVTQSLNTMGVFNDSGSQLLGILPDQGVNWATAGYCGAAGAPQTLTTPAGVSNAIVPGSFLWVVYLGTGTTQPKFNAFNNNSGFPVNAGLAATALRVGRVAAAQTSFPGTISPATFASSNVASPGLPWIGLG